MSMAVKAGFKPGSLILTQYQGHLWPGLVKKVDRNKIYFRYIPLRHDDSTFNKKHVDLTILTDIDQLPSESTSGEEIIIRDFKLAYQIALAVIDNTPEERTALFKNQMTAEDVCKCIEGRAFTLDLCGQYFQYVNGEACVDGQSPKILTKKEEFDVKIENIIQERAAANPSGHQQNCEPQTENDKPTEGPESNEVSTEPQNVQASEVPNGPQNRQPNEEVDLSGISMEGHVSEDMDSDYHLLSLLHDFMPSESQMNETTTTHDGTIPSQQGDVSYSDQTSTPLPRRPNQKRKALPLEHPTRKSTRIQKIPISLPNMNDNLFEIDPPSSVRRRTSSFGVNSRSSSVHLPLVNGDSQSISPANLTLPTPASRDERKISANVTQNSAVDDSHNGMGSEVFETVDVDNQNVVGTTSATVIAPSAIPFMMFNVSHVRHDPVNLQPTIIGQTDVQHKNLVGITSNVPNNHNDSTNAFVDIKLTLLNASTHLETSTSNGLSSKFRISMEELTCPSVHKYFLDVWNRCRVSTRHVVFNFGYCEPSDSDCKGFSINFDNDGLLTSRTVSSTTTKYFQWIQDSNSPMIPVQSIAYITQVMIHDAIDLILQIKFGLTEEESKRVREDSKKLKDQSETNSVDPELLNRFFNYLKNPKDILKISEASQDQSTSQTQEKIYIID